MNGKILLLTIALLVAVCGCSPSQQDIAAKQRADEKKSEESIIAEFGDRLNVTKNWLATIPARVDGTVFTLDLANALVNTNEQPSLFEMDLADIAENHGAFTACFTGFMIGDKVFFTLRLLLTCDEAQAYTLLSAKASAKPRFAIAAKINSVSRPGLEITSSEDGDKYDVDFSSIPNVFVGKGTCVDFLPLSGTEITPPAGKPNNPPVLPEAVPAPQVPVRQEVQNPVPVQESILRPYQFSCDLGTLKVATELKQNGWTYIMPQPKSPQAAWGNADRRTTWWVGYWANRRSQANSSTPPTRDSSGQWMGDNKGASFWRRGGTPQLPSKLEWLCSETGGVEPR